MMIRSSVRVVMADMHRVCDDMVEIRETPGFLRVALADGATGIGYGRQAALAFLARMRELSNDGAVDALSLRAAFHAADLDIAMMDDECDTTGIFLAVQDGFVRGASVGDSEAWLVHGDCRVPTVITSAQRRRPRVGSGCWPIGFGPVPLADAILLMGSDGLFNALSSGQVVDIVQGHDPVEVPSALERAVREENQGMLPDDFSAVTVWQDRQIHAA